MRNDVHGGCFFANLMMELYQLLGVQKLNSTAYHPQSDGLVERFNRTLLNMLAKSAADDRREWDTRLPYVLFAYRTSPQESTRYSPYYLLYGREAALPTVVDVGATDRAVVAVHTYAEEVTEKLRAAWELARKNIRCAQSRQKAHYDRRATQPNYQVGDCVMVHMPARRQGELRKLALPFEGPYKIVRISSTGVEVQALGHPRAQSWRVAWDRIRPYHASEDTRSKELSCVKFPEPESEDQISAEGIPPPPTSPPCDLELQERAGDLQPVAAAGPVNGGPWKGRLRLRPRERREMPVRTPPS